MQDLIISNVQAVSRAELDVQISTAKAYPRDLNRSIQEAISIVTSDKELAASCHYSLARKDRDGNDNAIEGKSIRLAEIIIYAWGNIHAAQRIVGNDGKIITAQAVVWDLERNNKITTEVQRSIIGRSGKTYSNDMQVVTGNAAAAIAFRNGVFKVVPGAPVEQVYKAALQAMLGDPKDLEKTRQRCIERLVSLGVTEQSILEYVKKPTIEELNQNDLRVLIGVGTAIAEGYTTPENAFNGEQEVKTKASSLKEMIATQSEEKT